MPVNYRQILPGVFRSGSLNGLSAKDADTIRQDGIRCIIDLRTSQEREEKPDTVIEGIEYVHIPLFSESTLGITRETGTDPGAVIRNTRDRKVLRGMIPDLRDIYRNMIVHEDTRESLLKVLSLVRGNMDSSVPTLLHCTAGKDRTGLVSSILLLLEGKDMEKVLDDYLSTNRSAWAEAVAKYLLVLVFKQDFVAARKVYLGYVARKEYLEAAFRAIDETFGSMEAFLDVVRKR